MVCVLDQHRAKITVHPACHAVACSPRCPPPLQVNYYPSAVSKKDRPAEKSAVTMSREPIAGPRTRTDYTKEQDEFRQPGERYRSFDEARWVLACAGGGGAIPGVFLGGH